MYFIFWKNAFFIIWGLVKYCQLGHISKSKNAYVLRHEMILWEKTGRVVIYGTRLTWLKASVHSEKMQTQRNLFLKTNSENFILQYVLWILICYELDETITEDFNQSGLRFQRSWLTSCQIYVPISFPQDPSCVKLIDFERKWNSKVSNVACSK